MTNMKKLSVKIFVVSFLLFLASCAKEDDNSNNTLGGFAGNWALNENSNDFGPATYNVSITDTSSNINIAYLYGFNKKIFGLVSGNNFTIPVQPIQGSNVSGVGSLTTTTRIDMTYYVQSTASHYDTIVAVLNKM